MVAARSGLFGRAVADALCLYLIPCAVAALPWRAGFALLRRLSRCTFLHRDSVDALAAAALPYRADAVSEEWKRRARLLLLVEHADSWLTLMRGERWWRRNIAITGTLPPGDRANLMLTFHWGSGNWIWRVLRAHGVQAHFLARRPEGRSLGMGLLSLWYGRLRGWSLRRIGCRGVIFTGDSANTIREALAGGASVIGMLDVGVRDGRQGRAGRLLDREARLPDGLVRIAAQGGTAVTIFSVGLDPESGRRDLLIETVPRGSDEAAIMAAYFAHLDRRLRQAPEAWLMWHEAHAIFASAPGDQTL